MSDTVDKLRQAGAAIEQLTGLYRLRILKDWLDGPVRQVLARKTSRVAFDMSIWGTKPVASIAQVEECGFAGCAIGWGSLCPYLRLEGLKLTSRFEGCGVVPTAALDEFFGISEEEAEAMFYTAYYSTDAVTIDQVIARINTALSSRGLT